MRKIILKEGKELQVESEKGIRYMFIINKDNHLHLDYRQQVIPLDAIYRLMGENWDKIRVNKTEGINK